MYFWVEEKFCHIFHTTFPIFLCIYFVFFFHRCQRLFLTRSLRLIAFAGQPLAGRPGVEQTTVPLKEQEDGMWKDFILMTVQNIV